MAAAVLLSGHKKQGSGRQFLPSSMGGIWPGRGKGSMGQSVSSFLLEREDGEELPLFIPTSHFIQTHPLSNQQEIRPSKKTFALLEMLSRLRDQNTRHRNLTFLALAILSVVFMVLQLETAFNEATRDYFTSSSVQWWRGAQSLVTALLLIRMIVTRAIDERMYLLGGNTATPPSPRPLFAVELVVTLLHLPPGVPLDERFQLVVFLRLYSLVRVLRDHSHIYRERAKFHFFQGSKSIVQVNWNLALRTLFHNNPSTFVAMATLILGAILAHCIYVFERAAAPTSCQECPIQWTYLNTCWYVIVATTTTGFGDMTAATGGGRVFTTLTIIVGIILSALLVAAVITTLSLNQHEEYMVQWQKRDSEQLKEEKAASKLLKVWWGHMLRRKKKRERASIPKDIEMKSPTSPTQRIDPEFERDVAMCVSEIIRHRKIKLQCTQEGEAEAMENIKRRVHTLQSTQREIVEHLDRRLDDVLAAVASTVLGEGEEEKKSE